MKIGQYREIPIFSDTKGWFKKDIKTIKNSLKVTLIRIPMIVLITFILTSLIYFLFTSRLNFYEIFVYFLMCVSLCQHWNEMM